MIDFTITPDVALVIILDFCIVLGGFGVVLSRQIVYSALFLGFVFVCVALWYLLLNADFLAAAQTLIYVGAVNVLIVFAVMLVNKPQSSQAWLWTWGDSITATVAIGVFSLLTKTILDTDWKQLINPTHSSNTYLPLSSTNNSEMIGFTLLTDLLLPFELLSILLLVALIGAVTIARKDILKIESSTQITAKLTHK